MEDYKIKGLMAVLAVALVFGLATCAFAAGKLSFGVKGGMGWMAPLIKGGDMLTEDWNDMVDEINQGLEDIKEEVEFEGGTATIDLAEKITRGWDVEGYAQYKITEMFGLRANVGYLTGMKSDFGYDATYWDDWYWDMTDKMTTSVSASCLFVSFEPVLTLPMGNLLLTLGGGPGYYMGKNTITQTQELSGDWSGTLLDLTMDGSSSGSKMGYRAFLGGEYSTGSLTIGAELGYRSTGEIETTGEITTKGEFFGIPVDETEEVTAKLDFSGLYILFGIGFAV
ncbi:MAG: outer membrane beta-barrel protein [Clostridia bacterium]|jgi:hypothetical protein|nr:outer membrane beta-barrel protein [Clostridia bacterium]